MRWRWSTNPAAAAGSGCVSGATADVSQPLLSPTYYVQRALAPFADVREPRMGPVEAIRSLLDEEDADARAGPHRHAPPRSA